MSTTVRATDNETGEFDETTIENDYAVICDGDVYVAGIAKHSNGTVVLTLKRAS